MNTEDKKNISDAVKNYVIAISIIVGGLWAAYVFDSKLEVENARAQLEKINLELQTQPVIIPSMQVFVGRTDASSGWLLKLVIEIENKGNSDVAINFGINPVLVARANMQDGIILDFNDPIYADIVTIAGKGSDKNIRRVGSVTVLAGQSKREITLVEVQKPGLYLVEFKGIPGKEIVEVRKKVNEKLGISIVYAGEYVLVGEGPNNRFQPTAESGG